MSSRDAGSVRDDKVDVVDFADKLYHCPFAIYAEGLKPRRIDALCSGLDLAPTLLDLMGIEIPASFRGMSLLDATKVGSGRDYVLMEHLGRGPYDPVNKAARIAVMNSDYKIVYEQYLHRDEKGKLVQAFDMRNRPDEEIKLASSDTYPDVLKDLIAIAKQRIEEIR